MELVESLRLKSKFFTTKSVDKDLQSFTIGGADFGTLGLTE